MPLPLGERVAVLSLKKSGNRGVEGVFFIRRLERPRDRTPLRVPDVLHHIVAEGTLAKG